MFFNRFLFSLFKSDVKNPKNASCFCYRSFDFSLLSKLCNKNPYHLYIQRSNYVDVKMKWKKDSYLDSIEIVNRSRELKALIALKDFIKNDPNGCIPIDAVSKKGYQLDVPGRVANFLRKFPTVFEEFKGEKYNLPWFKLTEKAIGLDREEQSVYRCHSSDFIDRLKKLLLMSRTKTFPLRIIQGMQWYLGLPDDFLQNPDLNLGGFFKIVEIEEGIQGLRVDPDDSILSVIQKNALRRGESAEQGSPIAFPLIPSKGLRLKQKIEDWLETFQKVLYISPYEDCSNLDPNSDLSEKRIVGVLHELLCLFVDHSAERKKLLCLRKHIGLSQKFYKAFERHPEIFYLSPKNKTCTVILKEAYCKGSMVEKHPIVGIRKKYIKLMCESEIVLKNKRRQMPLAEVGNVDVN